MMEIITYVRIYCTAGNFLVAIISFDFLNNLVNQW